jgi:streptomycin 6-kinase
VSPPGGDDALQARALASAEAWGVRLGRPYTDATAGRAWRARTADGDPAVLKVSTSYREMTHQAEALRLLDGRGTVRLLAADPTGTVTLLERCEPGDPLSSRPPAEAVDVLVDLLPRTWVRADGPFTTLDDEATWWRGRLQRHWESTGRAYPRRLLDAALETLDALIGTQGEQVLVNQDLHGDNVLAARREPWLVIDPIPLRGERAFAVAPVVRSRELGHSARDVRYRLDRLVGDLGLDRDRALGWSLAQTVAWAAVEDGDVLAGHVDVAGWLLDVS